MALNSQYFILHGNCVDNMAATTTRLKFQQCCNQDFSRFFVIDGFYRKIYTNLGNAYNMIIWFMAVINYIR